MVHIKNSMFASAAIISTIALTVLTGCNSSSNPPSPTSTASNSAAVAPAGPTAKPSPPAPDPKALADSGWKAAVKAGNSSGYRSFATQFPNDPRAAKAEAKGDDLMWAHSTKAGNEDEYNDYLSIYPKGAHASDARKLLENEDVSLDKAVDNGWVSASVSGNDLQFVSLNVERTANRPLKIAVPTGTYFVSGGSAQNMVATQDNSIDLTDTRSGSVDVNAACADFYEDQPDSSNSFSIRSSHPDARLRRLLNVIGHQELDSTASQLAIWSLTDNPSRDDVAEHISPAPSDDDYNNAAGLLRQAGISPRSRAMFE